MYKRVELSTTFIYLPELNIFRIAVFTKESMTLKSPLCYLIETLRRLRPRAIIKSNCQLTPPLLRNYELSEEKMKTIIVLASALTLAVAEPQFGFLGVSAFISLPGR